MKYIPLRGRSISSDRLYTSIVQANWLRSHNIITVGTMQTNRIGIPDELNQCQRRGIYSATCRYEVENKDLCLLSYPVKTKSKGMKNVLVLSTMRPTHGVTKPGTYMFYHFTKGGTDIVDHLNDYYSTRAKRCAGKWLSYCILDISVSRTGWTFTRPIAINLVGSWQRHLRSLPSKNVIDPLYPWWPSCRWIFFSARHFTRECLDPNEKQIILFKGHVIVANVA